MLAKIEAPVQDVEQFHSMEPWWIGRYVKNMKNTALNSLAREGFEAWIAHMRTIRQTPLRKIPPKKRHMARNFIDEQMRERFPGYIFLRRVTGCFDINRLFDLNGCGGVVTVASTPALVQDFDIELMRLAESDGRYDAVELSDTKKYRINRLDPEAMREWKSQSQLDGRLDDSGQMTLSVEAYGRVERIIALADAA